MEYMSLDQLIEENVFTLVEGLHHATITSAEVAESKSSGKPMLVVEWTMNEGDADAGDTIRDYTVFTIKSRDGSAERIHFNLPKYFGAAGQWPTNRAELKAKLTSDALPTTIESVCRDLIGKTATLTITTEKGGYRHDDDGSLIPALDGDGNPITRNDGTPVYSTYFDRSTITVIDFD